MLMETALKREIVRKTGAREIANALVAVMIVLSVPFCLCDYRLRGESAGMLTYRLISPLLCVLLLLAEDGAEKFSGKRLPDGIYAFTRYFAVGAVVFGRTYDFYGLVPYWDKLLHTLSGVMFTLLGFCFAPAHEKHDVLYSVVFALMFSLAVGYMWEILEFAGDSLFSLDSQRWQGGLVADLGNGLYVTDTPRGSGLLDTMGDMLVNLLGTIVTLPFVKVFRRKRFEYKD